MSISRALVDLTRFFLLVLLDVSPWWLNPEIVSEAPKNPKRTPKKFTSLIRSAKVTTVRNSKKCIIFGIIAAIGFLPFGTYAAGLNNVHASTFRRGSSAQ